MFKRIRNAFNKPTAAKVMQTTLDDYELDLLNFSNHAKYYQKMVEYTQDRIRSIKNELESKQMSN